MWYRYGVERLEARAAWAIQLGAARALAALASRVGPERVLAVKGVVTGRMLYAEVSQRPMADLDVRVRREDLPRVRAAARDLGWTVRDRSRVYGTLQLDAGGVDVDVESSVGPPGLCHLSVDELLARSEDGAALIGAPCRVPELHDHALVLAVNVFKDKLSQAFAWSREDLRRIARVDGFDPARLADRAHATASATIVWTVAEALERGESGDGDRRWRAVADALGGHAPRPIYAAMTRHVMHEAPRGMAARLLARWGSDLRSERCRAAVIAAAYVAEQKLLALGISDPAA